MDNKQQTLAELGQKSGTIAAKNVLVGLDGFIDKIVHPVDERFGAGDHFKPIDTISAFGERISAAAGNSTNIELHTVMEKIGGNGPIMANALLSTGSKVRYIGSLGKPTIAPVFTTFATQTDAVSVCAPGMTTAAEFKDGKILFGDMVSFDAITYDAILQTMGEGKFFDCVSCADAIALVNWTMLPHMTDILNALVERVLPTLGPRENRAFLFDLADPAKRADADIQGVLHTIKRFQAYGYVTLGLNFSESQQVARILGCESLTSSEADLKKTAGKLRQALEISCVAIHPTESAACATKDGTFWVKGPWCERPKITTGAGDHFNAGLMTGRLLGLSPIACLTLAVSFSGYYVRTAQSPTLSDIATFIRNWQ